MKICSAKHLDAWRIILPSRELTNSHQFGLQNKLCFYVHQLTLGLFYEISTELDEVVNSVGKFPRRIKVNFQEGLGLG